jgi:anti-sigma factor RsiW
LSHTEPHDEFLELCAISTSGQLSEEDQRGLQEHLAVCPSCRTALQQYEAIIRHAIPAIGPEETPEHLEAGGGLVGEGGRVCSFRAHRAR